MNLKHAPIIIDIQCDRTVPEIDTKPTADCNNNKNSLQFVYLAAKQ